MVELQINGLSYKVPKGISVLQACLMNGINVSNFCYHERLHVAGNCRMCLVEVKNLLKPIESCTMQVQQEMSIFTDTPFVKKAQENIIESLLYLHPLDCPICDQGGECDLQEQTQHFGSDRGRFYKARRGVLDKNCGVFIKTVMTRCIHCTRCVRFSDEIANSPFFGTLGRGVKTEIAFYKLKPFRSEISANVIDLCPVGALTSKPQSFESRPWEETIETESIDILDPLGSSIFISSTNTKVLKVLPRINNEVNKEWITDRGRFCYDSLKYNRLLSPFFRFKNSYQKVEKWFLLDSISNKKFDKFFFNFPSFFISGTVADFRFLNEIFNFSFISNTKSSYFFPSFFFRNLYFLNRDFRSSFLDSFNLDDLSNFRSFVLLDYNLKKDFSIYNAYLNINQKDNSSHVFFFGNFLNHNIKGDHFGLNFVSFLNFFNGQNLKSIKFINSSPVLFLNQIFLPSSFFFKDIFLFQNFFSFFQNYLNSFPFLNRFFLVKKNSFFSSVNDFSLIELGYFFNIRKNFNFIDIYRLGSFFFFNTFLGSFKTFRNFYNYNRDCFFFFHCFSSIFKDSKSYFLNYNKINFFSSHGFLDSSNVIEPFFLFPLSSFFERSYQDFFLYFGYKAKKSFYNSSLNDLILTELYFLNFFFSLNRTDLDGSLEEGTVFKKSYLEDFNLNFLFNIKDFRYFYFNFFISLNSSLYGFKGNASVLEEDLIVKNSKNLSKSSVMFLDLPLNF